MDAISANRNSLALAKRRGTTCDMCDGFMRWDRAIEHRTTRPSDPSDMCCVMATHRVCPNGHSFGKGGMTGRAWDAWIENEGANLGYVFLS